MRAVARHTTSILWVLVALISPAPADEPAATKDILWTEKKLYSYGDEELIIRDFFQDRRDGFLVDVGCAWPRKNSNTYYLEKHLGWNGIGVDGLPDFAEGWRQKRPGSTFLNFLVTNHSDTEDRFYKVGVWGLSTAEPEVAASLEVVDEIEVPSITLDDLLERYGVTRIDLLSIDVEGHQEEVLGAFDLQRWRPELVCIEDDGPFAVPWFKQRGYEPIERYRLRDAVNWYFAPAAAAAAANARETERGREERRKAEERWANEAPGSGLRAYATAKYVLGPDGLPVLNPRWIQMTQETSAGGGRAPGPASEIASE